MKFELNISSKKENINLINQKLEEVFDLASADMGSSYKVTLAVEEIFVNISSYAYKDEGPVTIIFDYNEDNKNLSLSFIDEGKEYNPLEKEEPDLSLSSTERSIGGLGIFLYKTIMDDVSYKRENNKNILTISKKL